MNEEEKNAVERIEDTFYSDLGKGINKFQKIILYEDSIRDVRILLNLLEKLQKENEELKFKERSRIIGKYGDAEIHDVINRTLSNDYIPVQKVKDKIEEYKNILKTCNKAKDIDRIKAINERILELEELLEGRKENERK